VLPKLLLEREGELDFVYFFTVAQHLASRSQTLSIILQKKMKAKALSRLNLSFLTPKGFSPIFFRAKLLPLALF
jgi:hypothetical protein